MIELPTLRMKHKIFAGFLLIGMIGVGIAFSLGLAIENIHSDFRRFTTFNQRVEVGRDLSAKMIELQGLSEEFVQEGHGFYAEQAGVVFERARKFLQELETDASDSVRERVTIMETHLNEFEEAFSEVKRDRHNHMVNDTIRTQAQDYETLVDEFRARIPESSTDSAALAEQLRSRVLQIERLAYQYFDTLDNSLIRDIRANTRNARDLIQRLAELQPNNSMQALLERMDDSALAYQSVILEAIQQTRSYLFLVNVVMAAETHEILYQSDRLAEELKLEMKQIEDHMANTIRNVFVLALLGSLLMLILVLGLSYTIGGSIARPIETLAQTFRRLARGESLSGKAFPAGGYELQELSSAAEVFREKNKETEQLLAKYQEISEALEERVKERTQELELVNRQLQQLSRTDGLTGLANRRYFEEILEREWATALRSELCLTIIMLDIDHFKDFNDRYGHQAGDQCLRDVSRALESHLRRGDDLAARYGGEEFIAILQDTGPERAMAVAENLRHAVSDLAIEHQDSPWQRITVSVGLAIREPGDDTLDSFGLIRNADNALYKSKQDGRNRVTRHN